MIINNNNYSIQELLGMIDRRELIVNSDYQRGSGIWPPGPSSYFIETILEGYPFPKIYLYERVEGNARRLQREIVDGQQRIDTIQRYYNDKFALRGTGPNSGKLFSELEEEIQNRFRLYPVAADVIRNASRDEILQMFRRMNAYTLPLNEAEKRHSKFHGQFKWFVNQITDQQRPFFVSYGVFTDRQIVRMQDAALIADLVLAIEGGILSTSPSQLDGIYKKYDSNFVNETLLRQQINSIFAYISEFLTVLRGTYMMKPYALHSLMTALYHSRYGIGAIQQSWGAEALGRFANDNESAARTLLAMAQAHEANEQEGPYATYVWGCTSTTDRTPRRTARVAAILRALGVDVPRVVDANLA
jgi:hypothetical protein